MTLSAQYFGANSWLLGFGSFRVLIDPWFNGSLSFPPGPWLIEGHLSKPITVPNNLNLLLLTQGLADHAHPPTLKLLPKSLPVICSPAGVDVVKAIGFEKIQSLKPGSSTQIEHLAIEATAGAAVPITENGYLLSHPCGSIYIEPHGFLDSKVNERKLDAVITPVVDLKLPIFGAFVQGKSVLPELIKKFSPLTILASTTGGEAKFKGVLESLIKMEGNPQEAAEAIGQKAVLIDPIPGKSYRLNTEYETPRN